MPRMVARRITLHVPLMSKARPRSFSGQKVPYMPAAYKKWKADVRAQLAEWWVDPPLETVNVLSLRFAGPCRADLDNLMGAILDCGNKLCGAMTGFRSSARSSASTRKPKQRNQRLKSASGICHEMSPLRARKKPCP